MKALRNFKRWLLREWRDMKRLWLDVRDKRNDFELEAFVDGNGRAGKQLFVDAGKDSKAQAVRAVVSSILESESTWWQAKRYGIALAATMLLEVCLVVSYSKVQKDFNTCLEQKDEAGFHRGLYLTSLFIVVGLPVIGAHTYLAGMLNRLLRTAYTMRLARLYLSSTGAGGILSPFYHLVLTSDVDSPDQRICADSNGVVAFIFGSAQEVVMAGLTAIGFSAVLLVQAPKVLAFILVYATWGTLTMGAGFGARIADATNQQVSQEADLRTRLVRVSENAESVAFFKGGGAEWLRFSEAFEDVQTTAWRLIKINTGAATFSRSYGMGTYAVVPLMVGTRYLKGELEFGTISQITMAFGAVFGALSLLMAKVSQIAGFLVSVKRLQQLEADLCPDPVGGGRISSSSELRPGGDVALRLRGVTLRTPPRSGMLQQTLLDGLSLQLEGGQSLMIAGSSGVGKSSLLRAVAGLWSDGDGRIDTQPAKSVFFLPQKPYMVLGTLREQLLYPRPERHSVEDSRLQDALREVNLGYLLNHHALSDRKEWGQLLSPGEQQRVNFARALLQEDLQLTLVDEGTSACDVRNEANLYELLKRCSRSYVSVGHRQALLRHHSLVLWLRRQPGAAGARPGAAACELLLSADFEQVCSASEWAA